MVEITFEGHPDIDEIKEQLDTVNSGHLNKVLTHNYNEETFKFDLPTLVTILRDHHIYEQSVSSNEIDILRTIEHATEKNDWITIGDLKDEHNDVDQSTIYRHLENLIDEGLVERIGGERSGTYRYTGP